MKGSFDFEKVGKRMSYTVPDDFFAEMEERVWLELERRPEPKARKKRRFVRVVVAALTTAAAVALFFVLGKGFYTSRPVDFADVEQAFSKLSTEDQMYMFSVYQDDIFINE